MSANTQGSRTPNLKCFHDIDEVEKNNQVSYRQRMIKSIYLRALSHRAIDRDTQVENHFTMVKSDIYLCNL